MTDNSKPRALRTSDDLWDKIKIISQKEKRSTNDQVLFFLEKAIEQYIEENPDIFAGTTNLTSLENISFNHLKNILFSKFRNRGKGEENIAEQKGNKVPLKILCVEDDPISLKLLGLIIENYGHNPVCVTTPEEAIQNFGEAFPGPEPFDTVIIDYHLPNINGKELLEQLYNIDPAIKSIIITADYSKSVIKNFYSMEPKPVGFVYKLQETKKIKEWLDKIQTKLAK